MPILVRNVLTRRMAIAVVLLLTMASVAQAQTGVQWSPDGKHIFLSRDVGPERWAITLNLNEVPLTATGNVFYPGGGEPAFIWCETIAATPNPNAYDVVIQFRCSGANLVTSGAFSITDYSLISDNVVLPGSFFLPPPEACDLTVATNGPNVGAANSSWVCATRDGAQVLQFALFANGTGVSSAIGPFSVVQTGCGSGILTDALGVQSMFSALLSPSKGLLDVYELGAGGWSFLECHLVF